MYNNGFGFNNPYYQPQRYLQQNVVPPIDQQPIQNTAINRQFLNGKTVDSIDVVKATDIPLDGSISYFPLVDNSAIVTKQLQADGTSKIIVFKPVTEEKTDNNYITKEDMKKALDNLDLPDLDDIKDDIKDLKQEIKDLKKSKKKEE